MKEYKPEYLVTFIDHQQYLFDYLPKLNESDVISIIQLSDCKKINLKKDGASYFIDLPKMKMKKIKDIGFTGVLINE